MEQNSRVFSQIDVQEFHLWRRKGQGHLSPFVISGTHFSEEEGEGTFWPVATLGLFLGEGDGKDLQIFLAICSIVAQMFVKVQLKWRT